MRRLALLAASATLLAAVPLGTAATAAGPPDPTPRPVFSQAVGFDTTGPLRDLPERAAAAASTTVREVRPEPDPVGTDRGHTRDAALESARAASTTTSSPPTVTSFEGLSSQDNADVLGFRVNPPDPVGDVGPNHYVQMTNLAVAVYDKSGTLLMGPLSIGDLWAGFSVPDCAEPSGDPIVVHDQFNDRWLLSQFTTSGLSDPTRPFWNCVAISATGDPTGAYYRYAFETKNFQYFPDYPKYGVWRDSYVITTREFGPTVEYGIGVYALDLNKMKDGDPDARAVSFFLDGNDPAVLPLVGDGLLPADVDGKQKPKNDAAIPLVGTQDDNAFYGAALDAVNVWDLQVKWRSTPTASLTLAAQLPVAGFDSIFPCAPTSRDCLPQPGITNPAQYLDVLSYRQRPTWRLAYRNFKDHEALVTNQTVEARPGVAGLRWYEIRRDDLGVYAIHQQGTWAPDDGVHRWMGSAAQDKQGNMALGYSVVNGVDVYPGIRFTGRLAGDPLGEMGLGEGTVVDGTGVQTTTNSRWGDYSSMNVDPVDDCTFWYTNEYYTAEGQASSPAGWQTRVAAFRMPGCA